MPGGKTGVLLGHWGEQQGAEYFRKKGYRILSSGYRSRFGEVDLIIENKTKLVFVEIKLRRDSRFAQAREFVHKAKQEKLRMTAEIYLQTHPTKKQPQFDVLEIYAPQGPEGAIKIVHLENAF